MTEYEKLLEARIEALQRKLIALESENRQLKELVEMQLRKRPPIARDIQAEHSCL